MRRPRSVLATILFLSIAAGSFPARASLLWSWKYAGAGISATGTFLTADNPDAQGGYLITAIAGTRNGKAITGLQPTGTPIPGNEPYAVDNLLFAGPGPQLAKNGFAFPLPTVLTRTVFMQISYRHRHIWSSTPCPIPIHRRSFR